MSIPNKCCLAAFSHVIYLVQWPFIAALLFRFTMTNRHKNSLAVSDLGVGLVVQPLYIARLYMGIEQNNKNNETYNNIDKACQTTGRVLFYASFFGITALTADRFLAIHLHLRYQELVTHKRVVAVVISIWILSAFLSLLPFCIPDNVIIFIAATIDAVCYVSTGLFSYNIYLAVRHHANQIQVLQVQEFAPNCKRPYQTLRG